MLPGAGERQRCLCYTRGAAGSSFVPSSPFCPGKSVLARWRQREVRCPCLRGEGYQRELSGNVICKLLLPRRELQSVFGRTSATQAFGQLLPITSSLVGAHLDRSLSRSLLGSSRHDITLQKAWDCFANVSEFSGRGAEGEVAGALPQTLADTDNSCTELKVLADWWCQSGTGNTIYSPVSICVQQRLQNNGPDSVVCQKE